MVRSKITYYAMLTPKRWYEIQQKIRARQAARAARIAAGLPPDSPEPEEEEEEEQPGEEGEEELAPMEVEEAEQPEQELSGFNMEQAEAEFAVAQSEEMAEQQAIPESIQDEAYVEANRAFLRQEQVASDALFAELDAEIEEEEEEAGAKQPEEPEL
nr:major centromere autoantigen B-like [Aegilops tauschii subsp. strangulata]